MSFLQVCNLKKYFPLRLGLFSRREYVRAVDDVSLEISPGETLGLVGESGCGKSTLGRSILRLIEPTAGEVYFNGVNIITLAAHDLRYLRREMQTVRDEGKDALQWSRESLKLLRKACKAVGL